MKAIVNGEVKEIEYITASGEDMAQDLIGQYESLELNNEGIRIMSAEQYDWWKTEIEKLEQIDRLVDDMDLSDELFDQYTEETNGCDLETQTNMQLAWLHEYQSNQ